MTPTFSLLYPSHRPDRVKPVVEQWIARADKPKEIEFVLVAGCKDRATIKAMDLVAAHSTTVHRQQSHPDNFVKSANAGAPHCRGKIIVQISDDFIPLQHWDTALLSVIPDPEGEYVVLVGDGNRTGLCTLPVLTRKRLERFGMKLYWAEYRSMFCDTELTARAKLDGCLIDARHLTFEHLHNTYGTRPKDKHDEVHQADERWKQGEAIFLKRLLTGYQWNGELRNPSRTANHKPFSHYVACIQATQDDLILWETCERLFEEGVRHFVFCCPNFYWDRNPVPKECTKQVHAIAARIVDRGAWFVRFWNDDLSPLWLPGMARSKWETHYRNFCVDRLGKLGFQHILIVDGDELWKPGLLRQLDYCVRAIGPRSACCDMIPLVGQPAVAVEGAKDTLLIYMRADERFRDIRSPNNPSFYLNTLGSYHFTAVRHSREELAAKMRKSGHYDDPAYRFEQWIKEILPNLKAGMKNVHMYQDGSLWPKTRLLTRSERSEIPKSAQRWIA